MRPQGRQRRPGRRGPHQLLADQKAAEARFLEPLQVGRVPDPALGHGHDPFRNPRRQPEADVERHLEGAEIAAVDADERRPPRERPLQLGLVVHLDQHLHAELLAAPSQLLQTRPRMQGRDHEHGVGAGVAGFHELVRFEDEVLAQQRQAATPPEIREDLEAALEVLRLGQDRDGGGSAALILGGERGRIEVRAQDSGRGGCLLDLGDHGRSLPEQGGLERSYLRRARKPMLHRLGRESLLGAGDLAQLGLDDLLEDRSFERVWKPVSGHERRGHRGHLEE